MQHSRSNGFSFQDFSTFSYQEPVSHWHFELGADKWFPAGTIPLVGPRAAEQVSMEGPLWSILEGKKSERWHAVNSGRDGVGKGHPLLSIGQSLVPGDFHSHPDSWSHTRVCGLYCTLLFAAIISFSFITPPFHPSPNDFFAFFVLQKIIFCSGQYSFPNCLFF